MRIETLEGVWKVIHRAFATDHYAYSSTLVKASTKEEAFKIFNENVADDKYLMKARGIDDIYPVTVYF